MATASRAGSGAFTTLFTHVLEYWLNGRKTEDVVFYNVPLYFILAKTIKKSRRLPKYINVRNLQNKAVGVQSFGGYDVLNSDPSEGSKAMTFPVANYAGPITMSQEEEWEFESPEAIADRMEEYIEQLYLTFGDVLGKDSYKGNFTNSKNILGLEQSLFAKTHWTDAGADSTVLTYISNRWRARKATHASNVYGGITRTSYTDDEVGGTGLENISLDFSDTTPEGFGYASGLALNDAFKMLHQLYNFCQWGAAQPNLIISSQLPYDDYEFAASEKTSIRKEGMSFEGVQLGYDNLKFKNAIWLKDEFANTQNATSFSDATIATPNIYMLNTRKMDLVVDPRADFTLRKPKEPVHQLASVRHMVWRGQSIVRNPRYCGRGFMYKQA